MSSQLMVTATSSRSSSSQALADTSKQMSDTRVSARDAARLLELTKSLYKADHQVEFLHLQAETEVLLQELHMIRQRRQTLASQES